jgi:ATP-binding cassette subfamily C protein
VLLFLAVNMAVVFIIPLKAKVFELKTIKEMSPFERRGGYLEETMHDFSFGKDIRVYGLSNWIYRKFRENFACGQKVYAKIEQSNLLLGADDVFLAMLRDGLAYGFLIYGVLSGGLYAAMFNLQAVSYR